MKEFFKQYSPFYKNYKLQFIYAFIGIILVAASTAATAYAIQPLLDDIFINKDEEMLYLMPIFVVILYTAKGFGRYIPTTNYRDSTRTSTDGTDQIPIVSKRVCKK